MVYSFDVFDTCLCRLCGEPRLMFDVLSLKVQEAIGDSCSEQLRQLFVAARVAAEGRSLHEIYCKVALSFPLPCSVEQMVDWEIDVERQMLLPVIATRQLVDRQREKGKILFVSDMYLPSAFIRERLMEYGFFKEGDSLYVSDELGAWKHDGSLFRLIHEKEDILYRQWHHYGDNRHSDVKVPRGLGIRAHHMQYGYLPYEEKWRSSPSLKLQYPAMFAGVARAVRLSVDVPDTQKAFVCDVSAPLMVSWVLYMMDDAQKRGIRRLYFCARDVHTPYLVARRLKPLYPDVEARYLFISMQAMRSEEVLCEYLKQEGVLSKESVALVDSNSSGNTMIRINAMANRRHLKAVHGYYLTGWNPSVKLIPTPEDLENIQYLNFPLYAGAVSVSAVKRLSGMRILFELVLSLNYHQRTVGYERHGTCMRPVLETDTEDKWWLDGADVRQAKRNNDAMALAFADALVSTGLHHYPKELLSQIAVPMLVEFVDRPNRKYLRYLHQFVWQGKPLVGPLLGKEKGVWHRGSAFYQLPCFLSAPLRGILSNLKLRRQLNHLWVWKSRK